MNTIIKPYKILLVDDDSDDRKYFIKGLHEVDRHAECTTATDGAQALEMLNNEDNVLPDFIFLDLRMPKVNGRQCLLQIKANERLKDIPVIVYSTSREEEEFTEMENLGAVRFISKPANTEEIYYLISQVLEEHTPRQ